MLVLFRKIGQRVQIASDIVIVVKQIKNGRVSLGIEAAKSTRILRGELVPARDQTNDSSNRVGPFGLEKKMQEGDAY